MAGIVSDQLINISGRHQVMLERLKSSTAKQFLDFLQQAERMLQMNIIAFDVTKYEQARVGRLLDSIERDLRGVLGQYTTQLTGDLIDTAVYEAQFQARSFKVLPLSNFEPAIPTVEQITAAVMSAPLAVHGYGQGKLLEPLLQGWTDAQIEMVSGVIRQGYYQGTATPEIIRQLRGTAKSRYKDGTMEQMRRSDEVLVRTAVQHCAGVAREAFYSANTDIIVGVQWVSTLDSRTSVQCQALDGKQFPVNSGPRPPIHPGCRSSTIPLLDESFSMLDKGATRASKGDNGGEQVAAKQTYYDWLKNQSPDFQDVALGKERGQLFREGGLSAKRFAELQLGTNFEPMTLDEMKKREPAAFSRAGL